MLPRQYTFKQKVLALSALALSFIAVYADFKPDRQYSISAEVRGLLYEECALLPLSAR